MAASCLGKVASRFHKIIVRSKRAFSSPKGSLFLGLNDKCIDNIVEERETLKRNAVALESAFSLPKSNKQPTQLLKQCFLVAHRDYLHTNSSTQTLSTLLCQLWNQFETRLAFQSSIYCRYDVPTRWAERAVTKMTFGWSWRARSLAYTAVVRARI